MAKKQATTNKKRNVKVDAVGQLHVHSSFNNIIVSLANSEGQVISWSSAGKMGFRGSKKNTPYAAQMAAEDCAKVAFDLGLLLMLLRWLQRIAQRLLSISVFARLRHTLRVQVMVVRAQSALATQLVSR